MAAPKLLLTFSITAIFIFFITSTLLPQPCVADEPNQVSDEEHSAVGEGHLAVLVIRRLLAQFKQLTCDKDPKICRSSTKGGPDHCCEKKCVDLKSDSLNCGKCGNKCKISEACCEGECLNLAKDGKNCGSCGNRCRRGSKCSYGMCNYA